MGWHALAIEIIDKTDKCRVPLVTSLSGDLEKSLNSQYLDFTCEVRDNSILHIFTQHLPSPRYSAWLKELAHWRRQREFHIAFPESVMESTLSTLNE